MIKITFPALAMKKGKGYEVPVKVSGLPLDLTSFMLTVTCNAATVEIDDYSVLLTMCENAMTAFNNSPVVYAQPKEGQSLGSAGLSLEWKSPYNRGCVLIQMASTLPVAGKVLVNLKVWAMVNGTPKFKVAYFNYGTQQTEAESRTIDEIGTKLLMFHLVDGVWTPS